MDAVNNDYATMASLDGDIQLADVIGTWRRTNDGKGNDAIPVEAIVSVLLVV